MHKFDSELKEVINNFGYIASNGFIHVEILNEVKK